MNLIANIVVFIGLGLFTGLSSAWYMVEKGSSFTVKTEGPWTTWTSIGRATADPYTRAHVARSGRLPIMSKSATYYIATTDSKGSKLVSDCDYAIVGNGPSVEWWSLTAYDGTGRLMTNPAARHAFNSADTLHDPRGVYRIVLSSLPTGGNWLPVKSTYRVQLILRTYQTRNQRAAEKIGSLPEIRRLRCR